ncbi:hypothetical protein MYX82_03030 [Acidobacteria bacterium AH-259-D05]|nr:hypothetical protein [Acidobacteria bacterium AH-259-D05]
MTDGDQILRAYAALTSLRANVPDQHEVQERWVREYNGALERLEGSLGIELQEFKVPGDALKKSIASINTRTGRTTYRSGLWCERSVLMHKLDSVLQYFTGLNNGKDKGIGFRPD